jgi:hypothetical protein
VSLLVVKDWMGHTKIDTTLRYAHLAPGNFDSALAVLERFAGAANDGPAQADPEPLMREDTTCHATTLMRKAI